MSESSGVEKVFDLIDRVFDERQDSCELCREILSAGDFVLGNRVCSECKKDIQRSGEA
jgi:hypothetical protein